MSDHNQLDNLIAELFSDDELEAEFVTKKAIKKDIPVEQLIPEIEGPFAVISDIHSNYDALTYALDRIDEKTVICLGDIVGYGNDPDGCISLLRDTIEPSHFCLGNHDIALVKVVLKKSNYEYDLMSESSRQDVMLDLKRVSSPNMDFLVQLYKEQRYILRTPHYTFAHSVPSCELNLWAYLTFRSEHIELQRSVPFEERLFYSGEDIVPYLKTPVAFIGHNHRYSLFSHQDKTLVAVGSVGRIGSDMSKCKWVTWAGLSR